jgi:hypothetical protein
VKQNWWIHSNKKGLDTPTTFDGKMKINLMVVQSGCTKEKETKNQKFLAFYAIHESSIKFNLCKVKVSVWSVSSSKLIPGRALDTIYMANFMVQWQNGYV